MKKLVCLFIVTLSVGQTIAQSRIDSLISAEQFDEARSAIETSIARAKDNKSRALLLNKSAGVLILQGKFDEAQRILESINSQSDRFVDAVTKSNLGFLWLNRARNETALETLQNALAEFQDSGNLNSREGAQCLANLALVYWSTGKTNQAEENGLIALQIRQRLFGEQSEEVAASYNDLGLVYSSNDTDKALEYYEKAFAIYQKIHGKEHRKIAIASNNIGALYRQMELYGDAVTNFETALAIWKKIYPGGHPNQASALMNLGRTYKRMGNGKAAMEYFTQALAMFRQAYGAKHPDISAVLNQIGTSQLEDKRFDEAIQSFQDAIRANISSFDNSDPRATPRIANYYNGKVLLYSLRLKAQSLEGRHYGKTLKLEDLTQALGSLHACDTLIDQIRHQSSDENDKIELGESAGEVYEDGVRIAQAVSEITIDPKHYRETAFYFAEKSKAAVLQESIAEAEAKSFAGIPENLIDKENELKAQIALLTRKLAQKPTPDEERSMRQALFTTDREYQSFVKNLEKDYPDYFNLKFNQASPTTTDVQRLLDDETAVVSYFLAEKSQRLYQFIITKTNFKIKNLSLPSTFDRYLTGLTNSMKASVPTVFGESASALSHVLVPSVPRSITRLVILPAGRLGAVPFEVLFSKNSRSTDFRSMPFLVNRFAISYEFSAGLLVQKAKLKSTTPALSIFLCAPVNFPDKDNLDELPGTESEVNSIANLFGSNSSVVKFKDANEGLVKSGSLSKYSYLHFATHGVVDESSPELSRIFLQNGAKEDGNLFAGEIYNLHLNAELTVLSACQTGLGKFSKGEGVIGLSRALAYAGSKNIIVSFWSVADESTSKLMTDFYTTLIKQKGLSFSHALQQSKIAMTKDPRYSSPYYWAPFVLIGK